MAAWMGRAIEAGQFPPYHGPEEDACCREFARPARRRAPAHLRGECPETDRLGASGRYSRSLISAQTTGTITDPRMNSNCSIPNAQELLLLTVFWS
jgi:hypothetical protein